MKRELVWENMKDTFGVCLDIHTAKNKDYASDGDAFANFRQVENLGLCTVEQGIMVRMSDKFSRIANLLTRPAAVADEKIEDTIHDLITYAALLKAYLHEKKGE